MRVLLPSSTLPAVEKRRRLKRCSRRARRTLGPVRSKVPFPFLDLHRAFLIVVDDAVFAFGTAHQLHLVDDLLDRVGLGTNGAGAWAATEGPHAAHYHLRFFARHQHEILFDGNQRAAAHDHGAQLRVVERDDRDALALDVLPDVELRPVRERENADVLAFIDAGIIDVPQFRALIFGIPLAEFVAKGIDALFGTGLFLVPARATERGIVAAIRQAVEQGAGLEQAAAFLGTDTQRVG